MASVNTKKIITEGKDRTIYDRPTIETYEKIRIINEAWVQSFAHIESNKKAIAEIGWYLYTHALMTIP